MVVAHRKVELLESVVRTVIGDGKKGIRVYTMHDALPDTETGLMKIEWGVNWSACGTVDAKESISFANLLKESAEAAYRLTLLNINADYNDSTGSFDWDSKEDYIRDKWKLEEYLKAADFTSVLSWLEGDK